MKQYKIVYTYFSRGLMEEEMTLGGLSLAYVRPMAYLYCYEDFSISKVYAEDGTAWVEVSDWAGIECQAEKARRDAETRKEEG